MVFVRVVLFVVLFLSCYVEAYTSFESSLEFGYYRDIQKKAHGPLLYRMSYLGFHEGSQQSEIEVSLYNDFGVNQWRPILSKALYIYPLDQGFESEPYRKSRIQVGRQLLTEGFDFYLLDGVTMPYYLRRDLSIQFFLGQTQDMDLSEALFDAIYGVGVTKQYSDFMLKASSYSKGDLPLGSYLMTQAQWELAGVGFHPLLLSKWEWDFKNSFAPQSLNGIDLTINEGLFVYLQHSHRNPRSVLSSRPDIYIYEDFAKSYSENKEIGFKKNIHTDLQVQGLMRELRFKSGREFETGTQEEVYFNYMISSQSLLTPSLSHFRSPGGELWDVSLEFQTQPTDLTKWYSDLSIAYMNKINQIQSWLYQVRSGYEARVGRRWTAGLWGELERNHIFTFDARIKGNAVYFY